MQQFLKKPNLYPNDWDMSTEEQAILDQDIQDSLDQADQAMQEVDTVTDIAAGLEDTQNIAATVDKMAVDDPVMALIGIAADMAVAGTDMSADNLLPTDELAPSMENFTETIKAIWAKIVEFITKAWTAIRNFFGDFFGKVEMLRRRIEKAQQTYEKKRKLEAPQEGSVILRDYGSGSLNIMGEMLKDPSKIATEMAMTVNYAKALYTQGPGILMAIGKTIEIGMHNFSPANLEEPTAHFAGELVTGVERYLKTFIGTSTSHGSADGEMTTSTSLMGNFTVHAVSTAGKIEIGKDDNPAVAIEKIAGIQVQVEKHSTKMEERGSGFEMTVLSMELIETTLKSMNEVIEAMFSVKRGEFGNKLAQQAAAVKTASEQLMKKVELAQGDQSDGPASHVANAMLKLNKAYVGWTRQPMMGSMAGTATTLGIILTWIEQSMALYKEPVEGEDDKDNKPGQSADGKSDSAKEDETEAA